MKSFKLNNSNPTFINNFMLQVIAHKKKHSNDLYFRGKLHLQVTLAFHMNGVWIKAIPAVIDCERAVVSVISRFEAAELEMQFLLILIWIDGFDYITSQLGGWLAVEPRN